MKKYKVVSKKNMKKFVCVEKKIRDIFLKKENEEYVEKYIENNLKREKLKRNIVQKIGFRKNVFSENSENKFEKKIRKVLGSDFEKKVLNRIVYHLKDWRTDGILFLALMLEPTRLTDAEAEKIFYTFVSHVPEHIVELGRQSGFPINNTFKNQ